MQLTSIADRPPNSEPIGALVSIYPLDDKTHTHHDVSRTSREIVDAFCERHPTEEPIDRYARSLARRLCHPEGGITAQNMVMLTGLIKTLSGEELTALEEAEFHSILR